MAKKYLDENGLLYFWQKIKALFVTDVTYDSTSKKIQKTKAGAASDVVTLSTVATSGSYNDLSNKPTIPEGVAKSTTTPKMDGTASVGSETKFAAGDHVHPHDTTKVDKVEGKGLSTNDYTTDEKNKLAGIAAGAEVNVNADWNATSGDAQILNKPTIPSAGTGTSYPAMDGTKSLGTNAGYARVDHVHPSDTSRVPTTRTVNGKALSSDIDVIAVSGSLSAGGTVLIATAKYAAETAYDNYEIYDKNAVDGIFTAADAQIATKYALKTTTVNGNALSGNITLDADDVSAIPTSAKGAASGVCPLDANSKVASQYLPSYVDDVIEAYARSGQTALSSTWLATGSATGTVITPEAGKIYILMADSGDYAANTQFRWSGTTYVKMADGGVSSITNSEIDTIVAA